MTYYLSNVNQWRNFLKINIKVAFNSILLYIFQFERKTSPLIVASSWSRDHNTEHRWKMTFRGNWTPCDHSMHIFLWWAGIHSLGLFSDQRSTRRKFFFCLKFTLIQFLTLRERNTAVIHRWNYDKIVYLVFFKTAFILHPYMQNKILAIINIC